MIHFWALKDPRACAQEPRLLRCPYTLQVPREIP